MQTIIVPFAPRSWQSDIIKRLKRNNVLVCHRAAGKTELSVNVLNKAAITGPPNRDYAYILPQANQAQRVAWPPLVNCSKVVPGIEYNRSTMVVRYPNGSRIHVLGADNPDTLRGMHLGGVVLDEFAEMHADTFTVVRPMLTTYSGWVIWIGTPKGNQNEFYKVYQRSQDPEFIKNGWFGIVLKWQDTGVLKEEEVRLIKMEMPPETFEQELNCSFTSALVGAYYSKQLDELYVQKRISSEPLYRPDLRVHTAFDLGISDYMAVWFFQLVDKEVHLIDYEENANLGFPEWKQILEYRRDKFGYQYKTHFAPFDIQNRELATGISRLESAAKLGIYFTKVPVHKPMDGILLVRQNLHRCKFYKPRTEIGLDHLRTYKAKLDRLGNDLGPEHDIHSHCADSFRYLMGGVDSLKTPATFGNMNVMSR
jgi:hypothetical protein